MTNGHPLLKGMDRLTQINPYFRLPVKDSEADGWVSAYAVSYTHLTLPPICSV